MMSETHNGYKQRNHIRITRCRKGLFLFHYTGWMQTDGLNHLLIFNNSNHNIFQMTCFYFLSAECCFQLQQSLSALPTNVDTRVRMYRIPFLKLHMKKIDYDSPILLKRIRRWRGRTSSFSPLLEKINIPFFVF